MKNHRHQQHSITIEGARQNNLKNISLSIKANALTVVTGVSGSGKSSLAFDTLYAEGQRRYIETFSAYARQFLDRMDKPDVDRIEGIVPAIAIGQSNPVRTSRSTVGTLTEINDYLKLAYARFARFFCPTCHTEVHSETPQSIRAALFEQLPTQGLVAVCFPVTIPEGCSAEDMKTLLAQQGYTRILKHTDTEIAVIQDRMRLTTDNAMRLTDALETALKREAKTVHVYQLDKERNPVSHFQFSAQNRCEGCQQSFKQATEGLFSFNSPVGACTECRGFGRVIGIDYAKVIPDTRLSLTEGAVKPFQTPSNQDVQRFLLQCAKRKKIPLNKPWQQLTQSQQDWVIEGDHSDTHKSWYGIEGFFRWLESKSYKMHVRVMLSKYRSYETCPACSGSRLKPEADCWKLGVPAGKKENLYTIASLQSLSIDACLDVIKQLPHALNETHLLTEIQSRLTYLTEVGLGYLTLDRQTRTLSGGEFQRINLTTALGTALVNTLFVLDEPSIGLHARDVDRLITVLKRLRDAGNTLVVVEHDPQVIQAADTVIEMGPLAGESGGELIFTGTPSALRKTTKTLTGAYLSGKRKVLDAPMPFGPSTRNQTLNKGIVLKGVQAHNLNHVTLTLPLGGLVCIAGVSGSGKSTLIRQVLYPALAKHFGQQQESTGHFERLTGHEQLSDVVLVDQSPIGKSSRSVPVTVVGAYDAIRRVLAQHPVSKERGYTPGTFSFNAGNGRCPACLGNGFEIVQMQFLSDVHLRCEVCDGRRFRSELDAVTCSGAPQSDLPPACVADILAMTAAQASEFFSHMPEIARSLEPLLAVGLEYLKLGQSVTTLSGGESQRLKLAAELAKTPTAKNKTTKTSSSKTASKAQHRLFLLDEPTTGLHFHDISKLMKAFAQLIEHGDSVVIIEHNLEVIAAAHWLIEIGPEGGQNGGKIVASGTPEEIAKLSTPTAQALKQHFKNECISTTAAHTALSKTAEKTAPKKLVNKHIEIHHANEHNLKNISVQIPMQKMTTITGVSGSGKSTLAFDILFGEGQRRYLESLNTYARQFIQSAGRPRVESIVNMPPTVAIEQRTSRGGYRSTVATVTELYHYLRLLFVKLGVQHCPDCDDPITPQSQESILAHVLKHYKGQTVAVLAPLVVARKGIYKDLAQWAAQQGFDTLRVDGQWQPTQPWPKLDRYKEHHIELPVGRLKITPKHQNELLALISNALHYGQNTLLVVPEDRRRKTQRYSTERACPSCGTGFDPLDPRLFSYNSRIGQCSGCLGTGFEIHVEEELDNEQTLDTACQEASQCSLCEGQRLNETARAVYFHGFTISDIASWTVSQTHRWISKLRLKNRAALIATDIIKALQNRLAFLEAVGLSYLSLDRSAPTLSGGEAQRIRLAAQLGSSLQGVCYILDEPTIGLHPRDNDQLIQTLDQLKKRGNTVVVVEHDEAAIKAADHIIDIGPGAGKNGGRVVAQGSLKHICASKHSVTGQYLSQPISHPIEDLRDMTRRSVFNSTELTVHGAYRHNLKNVTVDIPLRSLVCFTGVSGSGKSTLLRGVVMENLLHCLKKPAKKARKRQSQHQWMGCESIEGWEQIDRILEVNQSPIGKTPRSCPATYIGIWDAIRKRFSETPEARAQGFTAARFSFNTGAGRCPDCAGQGLQKIEMSFLPDVQTPCPVCNGWRFNDQTLEIRYKGKHIGEILAMDVDEAADFFSSQPSIYRALSLMQTVGLGYLTLGQQSPTLSGGEAQRLKLVAELAKVQTDLTGRTHNLYILDEPTVGLHMADVDKLLRLLHQLVDQGHSVMLIEHNLDVIASADWVIDMGPEGGDSGGRILAQADPLKLVQRKRSLTAAYLRDHLKLNTQSRAMALES